MKNQDILKDGMNKDDLLIFVQCIKWAYSKVEVMLNHLIISVDGNPNLLLGNTETIMFNFKSSKYLPHAIHDWKRRLYIYRHDRYISVLDYHKYLWNNIDVVEHNGGTIVIDKGVVDLELSR